MPSGAALRPQLPDQAVEPGRDLAPTLEPVARKSHRDIGLADAPLVETGTGREPVDGARAAREESFGRRGIVGEILALIGRAVAKSDDRKTRRRGAGFGRDVARINILEPLDRRQRGRRRDGDEYAVALSQAGGRGGRTGGIKRRP